MKRIFIIGILVVALLALVGWRIVAKTSANDQMQKQSAAQRKQPTVVELATAGPKDVANSIQSVGTIESPFQVKLSPNISGRIDFLEAREGDAVRAGEVLVRIDPQFVEGQILQAQSNVAEANQKLDQAKITQNASTVGIISTIGQNKAAVASAKADYHQTVANSAKQVGAAHEAYVDSEAKVASAQSNVQSAEANVELAKANLEDASAKYARTYSLYTQGFIAPQELDDARAAQKVDQATVNAQQKVLEAAQSALHSAQAQARAAADQEQIVRKQQDSAIEDAKAKLTQADRTLDTAVANRAQIPAYAENLQALYSEVVAAKAALNQALAQRNYLILKSPIDGTVTQRLLDPGAEATPGSQVLVIQALNKLFLTSAIPVEQSDLIHQGMDMTITVDGLTGKEFHSRVTEINKSADQTNRQFMIRANLDNPDGLFRAGMFTHISIVTSYVHAPVTVPREAVKTDSANNSTVTIVTKEGQNLIAHVTPVTLGVQDANTIQILSGVNVGDKVVILSYRTVPDGAKVKEGSWDVGKSGGKSSRKGGGKSSVGASAPGAGPSGGEDRSPAGTGAQSQGGGASQPQGVNGVPGQAGQAQGATSSAGTTGTAGSTAGNVGRGIGTTGTSGTVAPVATPGGQIGAEGTTGGGARGGGTTGGY